LKASAKNINDGFEEKGASGSAKTKVQWGEDLREGKKMGDFRAQKIGPQGGV
jgi:hypothetical protein